MLDRLTEKAVKVMLLAEEESRRLGQNFVGPEQLFLGLVGEGRGIAAKVLKSMGISLQNARTEVETLIGGGSRRSNEWNIPLSPETQRVLELALVESSALGNDYIGTEHLLLGLIQEEESVATKVLENWGIDPAEIRGQVLQMTSNTSSSTPRERFSLQPFREPLRELLPGISSRALRVWQALGSQVGWEDTNVEISRTQIIQITHLSEEAIQAALMELVELGIITRC